MGDHMSDRTLELILYVAKHSPKTTGYWVLKAIYFADRQHLLRFGRRLHEDRYIAMEDGPVPSYGYDLFKNVRYQRTTRADYQVSAGQFEVVDDRQIVPLRDPDMTIFSKSEIACLNESIAEVSALNFGQLRDKSHDDAWKAASTNGAMTLEDIVSAMEGGKAALPYIQDRLLRTH
jgi:uncharacterized phage-associated protein